MYHSNSPESTPDQQQWVGAAQLHIVHHLVYQVPGMACRRNLVSTVGRARHMQMCEFAAPRANMLTAMAKHGHRFIEVAGIGSLASAGVCRRHQRVRTETAAV